MTVVPVADVQQREAVDRVEVVEDEDTKKSLGLRLENIVETFLGKNN